MRIKVKFITPFVTMTKCFDSEAAAIQYANVWVTLAEGYGFEVCR
jgi:hypothetical protein